MPLPERPKHQYKYFIEEHGESLESSRTFSSAWVAEPGDVESDVAWIAEAAAEHEHTQCDGWESSWPLTFHLFTEGGVFLGKFSVEREYDPTFHASAVKEKVPSGA